MLDKDKLIKWMDSRIYDLQVENNYDNRLAGSCIGKEKFMEGSSRALRALKELKAYIESGLSDDKSLPDSISGVVQREQIMEKNVTYMSKEVSRANGRCAELTSRNMVLEKALTNVIARSAQELKRRKELYDGLIEEASHFLQEEKKL